MKEKNSHSAETCCGHFENLASLVLPRVCIDWQLLQIVAVVVWLTVVLHRIVLVAAVVVIMVVGAVVLIVAVVAAAVVAAAIVVFVGCYGSCWCCCG